MKRIPLLLPFLCMTFFFGCTDDKDDSSTNHDSGSSTDQDSGNIKDDDTSEDTNGKVDKDGKCVDKSIKEEPGVCGCKFEDKDINDDGTIDCPKRTIPLNALQKLEEIPGKCAEWEYPKHPKIEYPDLPEYGYEVTIDTEKYKISKVYDVSKAKETTKGFNQAFKDYAAAGYTRIVIPPGQYPIEHLGLMPPSKIAIIMSDDVTLQMIPNNSGYCGVIYLEDQNDIYIEGGTIKGERDEHTLSKPTSTDEECSAIGVASTHHLFINGTHFDSPHGDGITVTAKTSNTKHTCNNIIIANSEFNHAYRNGISICGCDGVRISNNHIHHTQGTAPQFGIDFEGSGQFYKNKNAIVDNNTFNDNTSGDLIIDSYQTFIEHNSFSEGDLEKSPEGLFIPRAKSSSYIFYRNKILKYSHNNKGCGWAAICSYQYAEGQIPTLEQNPDPSFFVENEIYKTNVLLTYRNQICAKSNIFHEGKLLIKFVSKLRLLDNRFERFTTKYAGDIVMRNVYGQASGNELCKYDENESEVCSEIISVNDISDDNKSDKNLQYE